MELPILKYTQLNDVWCKALYEQRGQFADGIHPDLAKMLEKIAEAQVKDMLRWFGEWLESDCPQRKIPRRRCSTCLRILGSQLKQGKMPE